MLPVLTLMARGVLILISKIITSFNELSSVSLKVIRYGTQLSCFLIIAGLWVYLTNDYSSNYSFTLNELSKTIAETSALVFAEIIIGGLMFDYYAKKHGNDK